MRGINKVQLIGHLGADPEVRYMQSGAAVVGLRLATAEAWKDKATGQKQEHTEWHSISIFGKLTEIAKEYLRKGSMIYIEGKLRTEKYTDKQGVERYTTKIIANELQMLDKREGGAKRSNSSDADEYRAASGGSARRAPPPPQDDLKDDEIPW